MAVPWLMHCKADVSSTSSPCHWVGSDSDLRAAVAAWGDVIALDTEFIRTNTFFPRPGLYQVASAGQVYLIDPVSIQDWTPFIQVLNQDDVVKVKAGYARNYLIPQGYAVLATASAKKAHAEIMKQKAHKESKVLAEAEELGKMLLEVRK